MSSNNYQIYINQTLQLAETIVVKSSYTAEALNAWVAGVLASKGISTPVDPDPATWKYYLNLAGEYHQIDQEMRVVSMDTLDEIIFNKENLKIHRATARSYQYGTRQYTELVERFPDQENLILGILYPSDLQKAIKADDGTILTYPPELIEENEYSLIANLQDWINPFKARWFVPAYTITDELYVATHLAVMHILMVQAILMLRVRACNTNEAHSFHIRQYLGSHNYLDSYMDTLTKKQALFFYRNIAYIERNVGKRDTFNTLTEHIMTERFIPLAEFTMKHDTRNQVENIYPEVIFRKKQLNLGIALPADNKTTLDQLMVKQEALAIGNSENLTEAIAQSRMLLENSPANVVATKALESSMVDESNSSPWSTSEILFNHWIYLSSKGLYTAYININNPQTGEKVPLTAKEAFIFAMYAFAKSLDVTLDQVPLAYASRVQRLGKPYEDTDATVDDIYSIVDHSLIEREVAELALSIQPPVQPIIISTDAFYTLGLSINDAVQMQRRLIARQENYVRRGQVQAMVTRIYSDFVIELEPTGTMYDTWLSNRNIDVSNLSRNDFELLYLDIVGQATGADLHPTQSIAQLQSAMVSMFTQLSSYGIQVIKEINDSSIRKLDTPYVRLGKIDASLKAHIRNPDAAVGVDKFKTRMSFDIPIELNRVAPDPTVTMHTRHKLKIDIGMRGDLIPDPTVIKVRSSLPKLKIINPPPSMDIPRGWVPFIGIENVLALSPDELASMVDIYNGQLSLVAPGLIDLAQIVLITELPPFDLGPRAEPLERSIVMRELGRTYPRN